MDNHEVTVEGVTYHECSSNAYPKEGDYFFDGRHLLFKIKNNLPCSRNYQGHWVPELLHFPLYEAIVVEKQPEWREVKNRYIDWKNACEGSRRSFLRNDIKETLKASRIRIHNVDGSVTEYVHRLESDSTGDSWTALPGDNCQRYTPKYELIGHIQLAFMRGSTVEVLG